MSWISKVGFTENHGLIFIAKFVNAQIAQKSIKYNPIQLQG